MKYTASNTRMEKLKTTLLPAAKMDMVRQVKVKETDVTQQQQDKEMDKGGQRQRLMSAEVGDRSVMTG